MTILITEEDQGKAEALSRVIEKEYPDADLLCFSDSLEALAAARKKEIQVAFLSVKMQELSGLDLGQYLKDLNPFVNLIYMDDTQEHAYEAWEQHASGYLLKNVSDKDVKREIGDLRYPERSGSQKRVFAQTFGNFELFIDDKPVVFKYSRTKEVVALLVNNRGAQTTNGEIIANLWEDEGSTEKKGSYLRNLRQDLQNTLKRLKATNIILKQRGSMAIDVGKIRCDLYEWLDDPKNCGYRYLGEYMNQYSWAEYLHAEIDEIYYSLEDEF